MDLSFLKDIFGLNQTKEEKPLEDLIEKSKIDFNYDFGKETFEPNNDRKEDHLYFVHEDRKGIVFLQDITEKKETGFEETFKTKDLIDIAKEGSILQFKNGTYVLYSDSGYDIMKDYFKPVK